MEVGADFYLDNWDYDEWCEDLEHEGGKGKLVGSFKRMYGLSA